MSISSYQKPPLTFDEQLNLLEKKGLLIHNKQGAFRILSSISYERFKAYLIPFKCKGSSRQLKPETTFNNVCELYEFDRELRLLVMDAVERVEVAVRTQLTYHIAHKYGMFAHENDSFFQKDLEDEYQKWLEKIHKETKRSSKSNESVRNYKNKYKGFPIIPIWMLTEIISFGQLSHFYKYLQEQDKKEVSKKFELHHKRLGNWLHVLNYVRNICAHHHRLWNNKLSIQPKKVKHLKRDHLQYDRIFLILTILYYLL